MGVVMGWWRFGEGMWGGSGWYVGKWGDSGQLCGDGGCMWWLFGAHAGMEVEKREEVR